MHRVLFVCTGNICRSPTAESVFRHKVAEKGLTDHFIIDSAGTHGYHIGDPPDHRSISTAKRRGVDMSDLRARKFSARDFEDFDFILALDEEHFRIMDSLRPKKGDAQLLMFLEHHSKHKGACVPDPYYGDEKGFDHVYDLIDEGSEELLNYILSHGGVPERI